MCLLLTCILLTCIPLHFISNVYTSTMYTSSSDVDITRSYFWLVYHHAPGQRSFPISLGKSSLFHVFSVWGSHLISVSSSCHFEKVSLVFGVWGLVFEAVQLSPLISDQSLTSLVSDSFQTIGHFDFRLVSESHTQLVFSKDVTFKVCLSKVVRSSWSFVGHHLVLLGLHRCLGSHLYQWVVLVNILNKIPI